MMSLTCDCLNYCGDDPGLRTKKSKPCQALRDRQHQEHIKQQKQDAADLLCQKFGVTSLLDLVQAQDTHIQRLDTLTFKTMTRQAYEALGEFNGF